MTAGALVIRPEREDDDPFLFALFCDSRPDLALLPLDPAGKEQLARMQFRAQAMGYRTQFPDARFDVIELDGRPVGRLVTGRSAEVLRLADIAIAEPLRGRGIGTRVLQTLIEEARVAGMPVRLSVFGGNAAALRLYLRLGFTPIDQGPTHAELEWRPEVVAGQARH